jgi:hypothetical protein
VNGFSHRPVRDPNEEFCDIKPNLLALAPPFVPFHASQEEGGTARLASFVPTLPELGARTEAETFRSQVNEILRRPNHDYQTRNRVGYTRIP